MYASRQKIFSGQQSLAYTTTCKKEMEETEQENKQSDKEAIKNKQKGQRTKNTWRLNLGSRPNLRWGKKWEGNASIDYFYWYFATTPKTGQKRSLGNSPHCSPVEYKTISHTLRFYRPTFYFSFCNISMSTLIYIKLQRDQNNNRIYESWITRIKMHVLAVPGLYSHTQTTPPNV